MDLWFNFYVNGLKKEWEPSTIQEPTITNIAGTRGMTRSGQIYGHEPQKKNDVVVKDKGKVVIEESQEQEPSNKIFIDQEAKEFLKIIKKSDYKFVD